MNTQQVKPMSTRNRNRYNRICENRSNSQKIVTDKIQALPHIIAGNVSPKTLILCWQEIEEEMKRIDFLTEILRVEYPQQ